MIIVVKIVIVLLLNNKGNLQTEVTTPAKTQHWPYLKTNLIKKLVHGKMAKNDQRDKKLQKRSSENQSYFTGRPPLLIYCSST